MATVLAGVVVGCIPPLKALLFSDHPPLRFVTETLDVLSGAMIPSTVMVLGAVLYRGPGASVLPLRVTLGVLVTRLVLMPIAGARTCFGVGDVYMHGDSNLSK